MSSRRSGHAVTAIGLLKMRAYYVRTTTTVIHCALGAKVTAVVCKAQHRRLRMRCRRTDVRDVVGSFCYGNGGRANRKLVSTTCATNRRFRNLPGTRWRQRWDHTYPRRKHHYAAAAASKLFYPPSACLLCVPTRRRLCRRRATDLRPMRSHSRCSYLPFNPPLCPSDR